MAEATKKYYDELNIFRAFVIIWVIIGHSFDNDPHFFGFLHSYAYSFHMKAFFVLSGLLFAKKVLGVTGIKDCLTEIKSRFLRLMVPYAFFTVVSYALKFIFNDYAKNKISREMIINTFTGSMNPNGGLWFLYALFIISVFALLLYKIPAWAGLLITAVMYFLYWQFGLLNYPILCHVSHYGVFFFTGMFIYGYYDRISSSLKGFYERHRAVSGVLSAVMLALSFTAVYLYKKSTHREYYFLLILTVFNTVTWYLVSHCVLSLGLFKPALMTVGNYGMDIYMLGYYVQTILRLVLGTWLGIPYLAYSAVLCIAAIVIPIPVSKFIVRKFRITRALVLGDFKKEVKEDVKEA